MSAFFVNGSRECTRKVEPQEDDKDGNGQDGGSATEEQPAGPGYFWRFLFFFGSFVLLIVMTVCAVILCLSYIVGSFILWILGIWMLVSEQFVVLIKWIMERGREDAPNAHVPDIPDAMPGQEGGIHWQRAWELATLRNGGVQGHFHVGPFLKSKKGLDMQHLARLVKDRDAKSKFEEELIKVGPVSLPHTFLILRGEWQQKRAVLLREWKLF